MKLGPIILTFLLSLVADMKGLHAQIYVEDEEQGISEYSLTGQLLNSNFIPVPFPDGFALSNNLIYIANEPLNSNSSAEKIDVYDATTGALVSPALVTSLGNNNHVGVSDNYILDGDIYGYNVYNKTTGSLVSSINTGNYLGDFVTSGNNIFAFEATHNQTFQVDELDILTGALIGTGPFLTGLDAPRGLAINGNTLYVSDAGLPVNGAYTAGTISSYDITTGKLISQLVSNLDYPSFLTYANGDLYVATALNGTPYKLEEFDTSGQLVSSDLIPDGVGEIIGLQVAPEPPSILLLLATALPAAFFVFRRERSVRS